MDTTRSQALRRLLAEHRPLLLDPDRNREKIAEVIAEIVADRQLQPASDLDGQHHPAEMVHAPHITCPLQHATTAWQGLPGCVTREPRSAFTPLDET